MSEPTPAPDTSQTPGRPGDGCPAAGNQEHHPGDAMARPPTLPTAAQLDALEADLDRVDAVLARLDEER